MKTNNFNILPSCILIIILSIPCLFSCQDFIEIDSPKTELIRKDVFESDLTAKAALATIYVDISSSSGTFSSITVLGGFSSDELSPFLNTIEYLQVYENEIVPTNNVITSLWSAGYSGIYKTNAILEGLSKSSNLTPPVKGQLEGEAKFLRAFFHFYLLNCFGDVPLIQTTDYRINNAINKTPSSKVFEAIVADLNDAIEFLPDSYLGTERVRPNKWTAVALLSRVYLYTEDWAKAEEEATTIINNSSMYNLVELHEVFIKNNSESIWQLLPVSPDQNTNDGKTFILTGPPTFSALSTDFVNDFEDGDLRKTSWVGVFSIENNTWYYPYKYKIRTGSDPLNEYSIVFRLAEQYLIRAEARAEQGNIEGSKTDLNVIRNRAGLLATTATTQMELLLAIEKERQVELFTEWGHRWLDLKRTHRADIVLSGSKANWEITDELYPIPESEILVNGNLEPQNPGY